ncbi:MAG: methyl-accepting chemotaxis protein [Firmicutes bacterium]|nr:methyl-accepting chemotaxis protein [Bacillota bacterium]
MGKKAEVKQKAKKRFFTLKVKMLIVAIVPVVVAMAAAMVVGALSLKGKISDQEMQTLVKYFAILTIILIVLVTISIRLTLWGFVNSLNRTIKVLDSAAEGNLTVMAQPKDTARKDETGTLARHTNAVIKSLAKVIAKVGSTSDVIVAASEKLDKMTDQTSNASDDVARSMSDMANGATAQATETQSVSEAVMQIGEGIEQTNEAVQNLMNNADTMKKAGQAGAESVQDLESISEKVKAQIAVIYQQTNTTNESAQEIHKATELIASIANETNLLALNASIEAARAGESGRGFAVVAEQIKNLAEQSNESAKTIDGIIKNLLEESEQAVKTMNTVDAIIGLQADKVETTKRVFDKVSGGLQVTIDGIESIASNTEKLAHARGQVMSSVESLSAIAEENAAATQETAASAEELAATISEIKDATGRLYKVSDELTGELNMFQIYE